MTASPEIAAAFEAWKNAELACYYATPCPDELMNALVEVQSRAFEALQEMHPCSAEDMLLKLFPILLREFEPKKGEAPLRPSGPGGCYRYDEPFLIRMRTHLGRIAPAIGAAMAEPHPKTVRAA